MATLLSIDSRLVVIWLVNAEHTRALMITVADAGKTTRVPLTLLDEP